MPCLRGQLQGGTGIYFCEGECQKYVHRQCAGLTKGQFAKAAESDSPYYCLHCTVSLQNAEIAKLKQLVSELTSIIKPPSLQSSVAPISGAQSYNQVPNSGQSIVATTLQHTTPALSHSYCRSKI